MRVRRFYGICLVAAAAALSLPAGASATPGSLEFGKCEKVAEGTGAFGNSACTKPGKTRTFAWVPLSEPVSITISKTPKTGNLILLLRENFGSGEVEVHCAGESSISGSVARTSLASVVLKATQCQALGASCESEGLAPEVIESHKLLARPGIIQKNGEGQEELDVVGLDFQGEESARLLDFRCGPPEVHVRGGVIARFTVNRASPSLKYEYIEELGKQIPEAFAEGPSEFLEWSFNELEWKRAFLGFKATLKTVSKAKIELRHCEANVC